MNSALIAHVQMAREFEKTLHTHRLMATDTKGRR